VAQYHRGTLALDRGAEGVQAIAGTFRNVPQRVAANKAAVLEKLNQRR